MHQSVHVHQTKSMFSNVEFMHEYYEFKMTFCYFLLQYLASKFLRFNKNLCWKARRAVFKYNFSFWCWAWRPCSGSVSVQFYHAMLWEYEYDMEVWALDFKDWLCHCFIFCVLRINFLLSLIIESFTLSCHVWCPCIHLYNQ